MKTIEELKARARVIAEAQVYCDDDDCLVPWQPYEYWDEKDLEDLVNSLTSDIYDAMLWAQGGLSS